MDVQTFLDTLTPEILTPEEHIDLPWLDSELKRLGQGIIPLSNFISDDVSEDLLNSIEALEIVDVLLDTRLLNPRGQRTGKAAPSELAHDGRWLRQARRTLEGLAGGDKTFEERIEYFLIGALLNRSSRNHRASFRVRKFERRVRTLLEEAVQQESVRLEVVANYLLASRSGQVTYNAAILHEGKPLLVVECILARDALINRDQLKSLTFEQEELARQGISFLVVADGIGFREISRKHLEQILKDIPFFTNLRNAIDDIPRVIATTLAALPAIEQARVEGRVDEISHTLDGRPTVGPEVELELAEARLNTLVGRIAQLLRMGQTVTPDVLDLSEPEAQEVFATFRARHPDYAYQPQDSAVLGTVQAEVLREATLALDRLELREAVGGEMCVQLLAHHLDHRSEELHTNEAFHIFGLHLPRLHFTLPEPLPIVVLTGVGAIDTVLLAVEAELATHSVSPRYGILIDVGSPAETRRATAELAGRGKAQFSVLDRETVLELLLLRPGAARQRLMNVLLSGINLTRTSPFQPTKAVTDHFFYGRDEELRDIKEQIDRQSFALVGGRRAGKTSILQRLNRDLPPERPTVFMTVQNLHTPEAFLEELITQTPDEKRSERQPRPERADAILRAFLDSKFGPGGTGVLLLDEVDKLFKNDAATDNPHLISGALRNLAQTNRTTIVMAGERTLSDLIRNPESPHWNFAAEMRIGVLEVNPARRLLREPLEEIGIPVSEEALDLALLRTARHPNLLQQLGSALVKRLAPRLRMGQAVRIDATDIEAITGDISYAQEVANIFWSSATALEKRLSVELNTKEPQDFDVLVATLRSLSNGITVRDVEQALAMLEIFGVAQLTNKGYLLADPILKWYYALVVKDSTVEGWEEELP